MENVGQSKSRNMEFKEKFNREKLLQHLVACDVPVIFDIGAHHGESVAFLSPLFPKATIFSFEPDPSSFDVLLKSVPKSVSCFNLAISDIDGSATFFQNKISHTNSLLKVNLSSRDSISIANANANNDTKYFEGFNTEVQVTAMTLDSFTKQHSIDGIDLLKIDVQGAESRVLVGGKETLKRTKAVVMEIGFFDYYEQQTAFMDVEKVLLPLGFSLYSISEVSNNPMNGRTDWAEVVYLNRAFTSGD
jgi:FkbM family methyltransferase